MPHPIQTLSIRQPWAWLIVHGFKDIENRNWSTKFRGPLLIHASNTLRRQQYEDAKWFAGTVDPRIQIPPIEELERGGIIGQVDVTDCVSRSNSRWFGAYNYGFVLANPRILPFKPIKGRQGFFQVIQ